ncbi:GyrI-like domain-containing protein [Emticicia sp. TH156]|uniref:GyrI-like domain-containing protein n=1 Tax=Emticicia sp. TH156 TaxID=2067454 RepID=UPI000C76F795|nr:GyrI-like domain-containing protein [Emticicia sp. TH156]PLK46518.1 GyrI-like domain-containing protein [Emticicia sp. TH156]
MPEPRIETLAKKKLVGKHLSMSFADNKTAELWRSFMPYRNKIQHSASTDLFSLQVYPPVFFDAFNPEALFEKWAAVEVSDASFVPAGMEVMILEGGLYAVFTHRGSSHDTSTFQYIFNTWLPHSAYVLDNRPHFELLGARYKNADPESEEEFWIPVQLKS